MIQDIAPHKLINAFKPEAKPSPDSPVVCFYYKDVLLRQDALPQGEQRDFAVAAPETPVGDLSFLPTFSDLPEDTPVNYLFTYDGVEIYRTRLSTAIEGFRFESIKDIRQLVLLEKHQVFLLMTALQLNNWYVDNRYCGRCATPTVHSEQERALICPECHRVI